MLLNWHQLPLPGQLSPAFRLTFNFLSEVHSAFTLILTPPLHSVLTLRLNFFLHLRFNCYFSFFHFFVLFYCHFNWNNFSNAHFQQRAHFLQKMFAFSLHFISFRKFSLLFLFLTQKFCQHWPGDPPITCSLF